MATLLYNPDRKARQELINEFVIRTRQFDYIYDDIRTGVMKYPEQHYLLLGQRGSGKTTLLTRLKYAVEDDRKLNRWLIPVTFNEEQYNIGSVGNIWEYIAEFLEDQHGFTGLCKEMQSYTDRPDFEEMAFDILIKCLDRYKKKLILFIDNIGDLLGKFSQLEIHRLREILQTRPHLRLIASSASVLDGILDYQQPLFEFFKMVQLKELSYDESVTLLRKLAQQHGETPKIEKIIHEAPARIEILRSLSGGMPRTIALLFHIFADNAHGNAINDLEMVLDAITPLYKHRMDDLPAQQQRIVDAVARNWEAVSVRELAERLRLESKVISAQLRQLEKNQVIEKRATETKNHLYLLKERFFNIWYLMRYGRKDDRQRVIWLVKFLEAWCDDAEIEKRITDYIQQVEKGMLDDRTKALFGEVYSYFREIKPGTGFLLRESPCQYLAQPAEPAGDVFDALFNEYLKKKEWNNFFKIVVDKEELNATQLGKLYGVINNPAVIRRIDWERNEIFSPLDSEVKVFLFLGYCKYSLATVIDNEREIQSIVEACIAAYLAVEQQVMDEYKTRLITSIIILLMIHGYTQLALSVINNVAARQGKEFPDKIKVCHYATLYYTSNDKAEKVLQNLGAELKEPVLRLINSIESSRRKLRM